MNFKALLLTIGILFIGIVICTKIVETENGKTILELINVISFVLGFVQMVIGSKEKNFMKLGAGLFVIILSLGSTGIPEPYDSGLALFMGIMGFFIKLA